MLISASTLVRAPIIIGVLFISTGMLLNPRTTRADTNKIHFDPRDCICSGINTAPRDVFTTRVIQTSDGYQDEIVEILTEGVPTRQVPGELISGASVFNGNSDITGAFLVYEQSSRDTFCRISIPSFDTATVFLRTLRCFVPPGSEYDVKCQEEFKLSQLKPFMDALATGEGTCPALATKYLGISKPPPEPSDSMLQCGGGTSPEWLASVLATLGLLGFRTRRRRESSS